MTGEHHFSQITIWKMASMAAWPPNQIKPNEPTYFLNHAELNGPALFVIFTALS
jgi:hypothetical protein